MAPERRPHGEVVQVASGYRAFIPRPLPPPIAWGGPLAARLSAADQVVGRLAGEGRRLRNPHVLIRPFVRREAVLSSQIEGTTTTLGELLAAEGGATSAGDSADLREVENYVLALEYGVERLGDLPLSLRLVRELHERLMSGVRGNVATPGEFRRSQNWIGAPGSTLASATYVPPPPDRLNECLGPWEQFLHDESLPPLVQAALLHAQFEAIHPFLDGNGRVGRLLVTLFLVERGILPAPLLYLSAYMEATRSEYYARLLGVTAHGEWEEWISYFLTGVATQAEDAVERIRNLDALVADWRSRIGASPSKYLDPALDLFVERPYWTVRKLADRLGVAFTTAQRVVERFENVGIVAPVGTAKRNRVYCSHEALGVLEAPANLGGRSDRGGWAPTPPPPSP